VVIDHGDGGFSMIAHFRLGSLAVRQGQHVAQGTLLGRCGNSGRSDLPHVHYHVQTRAGYGEGDGLPVPFSGYFLGGTYVPQGRPVRGDYLTPAQIGDPAELRNSASN
jgi:murein DD-endopeptidase MepM/ murein hydrolase activator NlpD